MKNWLFCTFRLALFVGLGFLCPMETPGADLPSLQTLEGLVGRWVDLRGQIADEQRRWDRQSAQWKQEMELLREEEKQLQSAISRLETAGESGQEHRADLMARRDRLQQAMRDVDSVLDRFEPLVISLAAQVPASLVDADLETALKSFSNTPDKQEPVTAQLQRMLGILTAIETLQSKVHVTRAMITLPDQPRREMDVIFIGLASGYAVTADNQLAAVGFPTPEGWQWRPLANEAAQVRRLIAVAHKDIAPELVTFPIRAASAAGKEETP